jgi:hypothetical protein
MPKNVLLPFRTIPLATDLALTRTSAVTNIQRMDSVGIQVDIASADAVGTLSVQVSADYDQDAQGNVLAAGSWIELTSQAIAAGQPSATYFNLPNLSAPWIRLVWTYTSGTGTITAAVTAKALS